MPSIEDPINTVAIACAGKPMISCRIRRFKYIRKMLPPMGRSFLRAGELQMAGAIRCGVEVSQHNSWRRGRQTQQPALNNFCGTNLYVWIKIEMGIGADKLKPGFFKYSDGALAWPTT